MIIFLKKSSYKESLWKNGLGSTRQIDIFPQEATVANNYFLWRISSATVDQKNSFSLFLNYERQLVVWKGEGLVLNGRPLFPNSPLTFSGEENIICDLVNNSPVIDLGIIYKKELIKASLKVLSILTPASLEFHPGIHFLFLAKAEGGDCIINGKILLVGDCLKIENQEKIYFSSEPQVALSFYQISIEILY